MSKILTPSPFCQISEGDVVPEALKKCQTLISKTFSHEYSEIPFGEISESLQDLVSFLKSKSNLCEDEIKEQVFLLFQDQVGKYAGEQEEECCDSLRIIAKNFCIEELWECANETYLEALSEAPEDIDLKVEYGSFLLKNFPKDELKAKELFFRAAKQESNEKTMLPLVAFYISKDELEVIDERFESFVQKTSSWRMYAVKALFEQKMEEPEKVESMLQKACKAAEGDPVDFALDLLNLGFVNLAEDWIHLVGKEGEHTLVLQARVHRLRSEYEKANEILKDVFRNGSPPSEAWLEAALLYDNQGKPEALPTFRRYLASLADEDKPDEFALRKTCLLSLENGDSKFASEASLRRTEAIFLRLHAEALLALGNESEALSYLSQATKRNPRDGASWALLSKMHSEKFTAGRLPLETGVCQEV